MEFFERKVTKLFSLAGVQSNGPQPFDVKVHNKNFFRRFLTDGRLGLGESYMDGWWDCEKIDEMLYKLITAEKVIVSHVRTPKTLLNMLASRMMPHGSKWRSQEIGKSYYDIGNELYERILDPTVNHTCGYWAGGATTLEQAQIAKMDRICQKLMIRPGMRLLDIGCGWGGFAKYVAENYGAHVAGISISDEQLKYARKLCEGLPTEFQYLDYRDLEETFDRIVSVGMFEHVGLKYYRKFMEKVHDSLADDGIFVLHTIGFNTSDFKNPWLQKYIFPGCFVPSLKHVAAAYEGLFVLEHVENIGFDYAQTLLTWYDNLEKHWKELKSLDAEKYNEKFFRTWRYYLLSTAAGFRARKIQLWQFVFSKNGVAGGYVFPPPSPGRFGQ